MRIFDIEIFRDGGSVEFYIEKSGTIRRVWLESPLFSDPQKLQIDSVTCGKGSAEIRDLLSDIECWWKQMSPDTQALVLEVMVHKGAYYNPSAEISNAIDIARVMRVRNYVQETYGG